MPDHQSPTLAEFAELERLERLERRGLLANRPALRAKLARLRAERARAEAEAAELATALELLEQAERAARVVRHVLPVEGDQSRALIVSLPARTLATETIDGVEHTYELGGVIGFVDGENVNGETWTRIGPQVHASLAAAHPMCADGPTAWVIFEPHEDRGDLLRRIPRSPPCTMPRAVWLEAIARQIPLGELARRWFQAATDSHDQDAGRFAVILHRRYGALGRAHELEPERRRGAAE